MATFPKREPDVIRLAHDISGGLAANKDLFPAPPTPPDQGLKLIEAYYSARDASLPKILPPTACRPARRYKTDALSNKAF